MNDGDCVAFLQWALSRMNMRWSGFRRVRRQVCRRIQKRIAQLGLSSVDAYRSYLTDHPEEWPILDRCCRVTISRFYRDRGVFDRLFRDVLPEMARLALDAGERMVSCWSAGCASGEEAYTLVIGWEMLWRRHFPGLVLGVEATDIDEDLLNRARRGCYTAGSLKELPKTWRDSAFERTGEKRSLKSEYHKPVIFRREDIRKTMPAGPFHLILCRNLVFTYFETNMQREILNRLKERLASGGVLVIGCHETPAGWREFKWFDRRAKNMKRTTLFLLALGCLLSGISAGEQHQKDMEIWTCFVKALQKGDLTVDRIRPYPGLPKEALIGFLKDMKEKATWTEWEAPPEVHRVDHHLHYLIPLTFDGHKTTYCFTFLMDKNEWYFRHLEAIFIRLDKISSLPVSTFPDLPESRKAWMREEIRVSKLVWQFNFISKEKGKEFACNWFRDGAGYFMGAKTWVPFFPASKAFILYICWMQANLRGNLVTLEKLDNNEAIVKMDLIYFKLYKQTGHLKRQISFEDYRQIFETIWQDRAKHAGWNLQIQYEKGKCIFHFTK